MRVPRRPIEPLLALADRRRPDSLRAQAMPMPNRPEKALRWI
jgi:hypothetical protein